MKRSAAAAKVQRAEVTALDVKHGDATLIDWRDGPRRWTCLIDGGLNGKQAIRKLAQRKIERLDLMVATHLDSDHVSGLIEVARHVDVASYWGPALPAFERHRWLFGRKCQKAIARGEKLEQILRQRSVPILYPIEGYRTGSPGMPLIQVLSPAARLIYRLLTAEDVRDLFTQTVVPLGWLLRSEESEQDDEEDQGGEASLRVQLRERLLSGVLEPSDLTRPLPPVRERGDAGRLAEEWARKTGSDPEFFGDPIFNNTSLVLWVELPTASRVHRLLFPGDQENWTYLYARHPRGLQADILKASHHGGRVYLESELTHEELIRWIRPRALLVSASGRYGLPRMAVRDAAVRVGVTVFCTSRRGAEFVLAAARKSDGDAPSCCHDAFRCGDQPRGSIELELDEEGIRARHAACHSGHGAYDTPVIELRQHVIDPSPVMSELFEEELRNHLRWVEKYLEGVHARRIASRGTSRSDDNTPVTEEQLQHAAREAGRTLLVPHLRAVLRAGMAREKLWSKLGTRREPRTVAYRWAKKADIASVIAALDQIGLVLFASRIPESVSDATSVLAQVDPSPIAKLACRETLTPDETFADTLWPSLSRHLAREWHGFRHPTGVIALASAASTKALVKRLLALADLGDDDLRPSHQALRASQGKDILLPMKGNEFPIALLQDHWWTATGEPDYWGKPSTISRYEVVRKGRKDRGAITELLASCIRRLW